MSEENELNAGDVVEEVAPDNFSLFDLLDGITYPTDDVVVSLDEKAAYDVIKLGRKVDAMTEATQEEIDAVLAESDALHKRIEASKVTISLRGIPSDLITTAKDSVDELFMDKRKQMKAADGTIRKYLPEEEALNYARMLNAYVYSMYIEKVHVHRNGATFYAPVDPDWVAGFYDKAPDAAKIKLTEAINALRVQSAEYEGVLDEGFFPNS